jgi:hypothetical protein
MQLCKRSDRLASRGVGPNGSLRLPKLVYHLNAATGRVVMGSRREFLAPKVRTEHRLEAYAALRRRVVTPGARR